MADLVATTLEPILEELGRGIGVEQALRDLREPVKALRAMYWARQPDFSTAETRRAYCVAYHPYHAHLSLVVLNRFADVLTFTEPVLRVVVFGAGPAPELVALCRYLAERCPGVKQLEVDLVDRESGWVDARRLTVDATLPRLWDGELIVRHHVLDLTTQEGIDDGVRLVGSANLVFAQALFTELRMHEEAVSFMQRLIDSFAAHTFLLATDFSAYAGFVDRLRALEERPDVRPVRSLSVQCPMPSAPEELRLLYTGESGLIQRSKAVIESRLYARPGWQQPSVEADDSNREVADQAEALEALRVFLESGVPGVFVLAGSAGTGKTHVIARAARVADTLGRFVELWAPTGQAARRLSMRAGWSASTIHSALYGDPTEIDRGADSPPRTEFRLRGGGMPGRVVFIDEASLVGNLPPDDLDKADLLFGSGRLLDDILTVVEHDRGVVVLVGDRFQLPPYGEDRSLALDLDHLRSRGLRVGTAELTTVNRQRAGSSILSIADRCREAASEGSGLPAVSLNVDTDEVQVLRSGAVPEWLLRELASGEAVAVTFRHADAARWIKKVRTAVERRHEVPEVGDLLVTVRASFAHGLMNGEDLTIAGVGEAKRISIRGEAVQLRSVTLVHVDVGGTPTPFVVWLVEDLLHGAPQSEMRRVQRVLWADFVWRAEKQGAERNSEEFRQLRAEDPYVNALWCMYSYARTCQRAQGGEWNHAICDLSGISLARSSQVRFGYTAITRARSAAWLVGWPTAAKVERAKRYEAFVDFAHDVVSRHLGPVVRVKQPGSSPYISLRRAPGDSEVVVNLYDSLESNVQKPLDGDARVLIKAELDAWVEQRSQEDLDPPDECLDDAVSRLTDLLHEEGMDLTASRYAQHQVLLTASSGDRSASLRLWHSAAGALRNEVKAEGDVGLLDWLRTAVEKVRKEP